MSQRVKGQEVRVTLTSPFGVETSLTDVQSCEITFLREILTEQYLNETTDRKDDIFKGVSGHMDIHVEDQNVFRFIQGINDRSKRRTAADGVYNVIATLSLPNGDRPRVLLENVFFGEVPINTASREEYVSVTISFECSDGRWIFS